MSIDVQEGRPGGSAGAGREGGPARNAAGPVSVRRAWDLRPGDHFHGRTVASVHGEVGLASHPVAVISFTSRDAEHAGHSRVAATRADTDRGHDVVRVLARAWIRSHGLREGDAVDLARLRAAVVTALARS